MSKLNYISPIPILLSMVFLLKVNLSIAQIESPNIDFLILDTQNGLTNNFITASCQDSFGFIWVGTTNGLCRYDSKDNFKIFTENQSDNPTIQNSNIRCLLADSKNRLWVGTRLGGISCYDQINRTWTTYQHNTDDPSSLTNNEVLNIHEDRKGRIWVGTQDGLNLFQPETQNFYHWKNEQGNPRSLKKNAVLAIFEDSQGLIWIGSWDGGLDLILNSDSNNYSDIHFRNFTPPGNIAAKNVWKIIEDHMNRIWVGTHGGGIFVLEKPENASHKESEQDWNLEITAINNNNNTTLGSMTIDEILLDKNHELWFGTTNGVFHLSKESINKKIKSEELQFHRYAYAPDDISSISHSVINCITQSSDGLIWVGTLDGLNYFNNAETLIEYIKLEVPLELGFLNQHFVILDNQIWYVNNSDQLKIYDQSNMTTQNITLNGITANSKLLTIKKITKDQLLIASNFGIIEYNIKTKKLKEYKVSKEILEKTNHMFSRKSLVGANGIIYLSTEFGVVTVNRENGKFHLYSRDDGDINSLTDNSITDLFLDSNDTVWVATYNGLNKVINYEDGNLKFKRYYTSKDEGEINFESNQVISLEEVDKILYAGTTNGLGLLDLTTGKNPDFKLPIQNNFVLSLVKDNNDNLWYSTTDGINCFDTKTQTTGKYGIKDGIKDRAFRLMTSDITEDGTIYFGSHTGISKVKTNHINEKVAPPEVYITELKTIGLENENIVNVLNAEEITLEANNYYLELNFVGLNYDRIEDTQYAYMLEGLDEDWFYSDKNTSAVYTNLKPGTYTFKVKAANKQGVWNEEGAQLKITKKPTLLETIGFQALLFALGCIIIWFLITRYTKRIKQKNQTLQDFNDSLNSEIEERLKVEKDLLKTNQDLQQFAYSASHDLQEPLRNIGNAVGLLKRKNTFDDRSNEYVEIAVDGVKRMSSLIQNLLNYAKSGTSSININETDLKDVVQQKLNGLTTLIAEKNANILIKDLPTIQCESEQIGIVFYNLVNNALKFNDKDKPEIEIGCNLGSHSNLWQFYVKDNGLGIQPEYQNRIFTMFTRLENKREYEGTGIGLTLCQKIVTRHNGTIWVSSTPKQGSTFFFTVDKNLTKI